MDLSKYYEEICKQPILKKNEERELLLTIENKTSTPLAKKKARDRILAANLRFVFKQAKKYSKNDPSTFGELIAAGNEGLIVALDKFSSTREVRFLTYAGFWVKQRILKEMSKMRIVSLPIWKQQLAARIERLKTTNENLTFDQVKEAFPEVQEKDLRELFDTKYLTYYIDDMEEDNFQINPIEAHVEKDLDDKLITDAVASLPYPHREIISMTYGLVDGKEEKSATIIKKLGLSREQFKECKKEAMEMLKTKFKPSRNAE